MSWGDAELWGEYDAAADWCAVRGAKWRFGDQLPDGMSERCKEEIDADPEAFGERVSAFAYARAMEGKDD